MFEGCFAIVEEYEAPLDESGLNLVGDGCSRSFECGNYRVNDVGLGHFSTVTIAISKSGARTKRPPPLSVASQSQLVAE